MGIISTAVKHLIAAGMSGDELVAAIAEMESERHADRAAENRRAYDRERKAAERAAEKAAKQERSGGSPVESADNTDLKGLDKKGPQTPKKINPKDPPIVPPWQAEWVPQPEWAAFEEMRRRIRKPMTDRARELAVAELGRLRDEGHEPEAVLNHAVMNSYQGLFPPRARASPQTAGDMW